MMERKSTNGKRVYDPSARASVVMIIGTLDVGGTERHVSQVAPRLSAQGFDVSVLVLTEPGILAGDLRKAGTAIFAPPLSRWLTRNQVWWRRAVRLCIVSVWLWALLRRSRPQIAHAFLPEAHLVGSSIARLAGVPVRVMSRRSLNGYQRRRPFVARLERRVHRWVSGMSGNSAAVVRQLSAELHGTEITPRLIYNGIEGAEFMDVSSRARTRETLAIPHDALVFVIVANLIPYKGHSDLLAALALIHDRLPVPWRLVCIGRDNGIGPALIRKSRELGIAENVMWLGLRRDVAALLTASDIGVLCSHEEGFANAIIEGMAAGLPMVVTDVGGNAEAVVDGETGLVVASRDPRALADPLLTLALDPARREAFGRAARRRFKERFQLNRCVDEYAAWYREFLNRREQPAAIMEGETSGVSRSHDVGNR